MVGETVSDKASSIDIQAKTNALFHNILSNN